MPVPLLKARLSNCVNVVTAPVLTLIHIPLESVFLTVRPLMLSAGVAAAAEPTLKA